MRAIRNKIYEEYRKSTKLRELSNNKDLPMEKAISIRKLQQISYDKQIFFKKLNDAIERAKRKEGGENKNDL